MNFDCYHESLGSFARTAELVRKLATSFSETVPEVQEVQEVQEVPLGSFPPPPLRLKGSPPHDEPLVLECFRTVHSLCLRTSRVGVNQASWNRELIEVCRALGEKLPRLIRGFHADVGRVDQARTTLREMKRRLKESSRLSPGRQRRWNDSAMSALGLLVRAHRSIGGTKLERLGFKGGLWERLQAHLERAKKSNAHAGRGLRRLFGNAVLDQRCINHECFRVVEELCRLQGKLTGFLRQQADRRTLTAMETTMQAWMAKNTAAIMQRVEAQRVANKERFEKLQAMHKDQIKKLQEANNEQIKKLVTIMASHAWRIGGLEDEVTRPSPNENITEVSAVRAEGFTT